MKILNKHVTVITWILAYIATAGFSHMLTRLEGMPLLNNSIFAIFIFVALGVFFRAVFVNLDRRLLLTSIIPGFVFSMFMIFAANLFAYDTTAINKLKTWLNVIAETPFFTAMIICVFRFLPKCNEQISCKSLSNIGASLSLKKYFMISWGLIFIAWIPALLSQYPGVYGYDIIGQIDYWYYGVYSFTHPPVHTWLAAFCTTTIGEFFGSYQIGFLIYILIQMLCVAASFAVISCLMFVKKLSGLLRLIWQAYFMFFPFNPIMAISATKDILYASFFSMFVLTLFLYTDSNEESFKSSKKLLILTILFAFLSIIFRSQGIYVFVFGIIAGFIVMTGQRLRVSIIAVSGIVMYAAYVSIAVNVFDTLKDDKYTIREMVGLPTVQLSRVAVYEENKLSEEEFSAIKEYVPHYSNYHNKMLRSSSDPVRASVRSDLIIEDPKYFLKLWLELGYKYPIDYFDALCQLSIGEWYPDLIYRKYYDGQPYVQYESFKIGTGEDEGYCLFVNNYTASGDSTGRVFLLNDAVRKLFIFNSTVPGFNWLHNFYKTLAYKNSYELVPVISMLFSTGFIVWMLIILSCYFIYLKKYQFLFPVAFLAGLWLTMILGPLVLYRYTFPLAMSLPILFTYAVADSEQ